MNLWHCSVVSTVCALPHEKNTGSVVTIEEGGGPPFSIDEKTLYSISLSMLAFQIENKIFSLFLAMLLLHSNIYFETLHLNFL